MSIDLDTFIKEHCKSLPDDAEDIDYQVLLLDFCQQYPPTDEDWMTLLILYSDRINARLTHSVA